MNRFDRSSVAAIHRNGITTLRQQHSQSPDNAWDVLESLTGTIEAPADRSTEHDRSLYGTPKHQEADS